MLEQGKITISRANDADFKLLVQFISEFELDNRTIFCEQFLVGKINNTIVGFGRIRVYNECEELCSLGVIEDERMKGIGKELSIALVKQSTKPLYLVCIIPQFFEPLGFNIVTEYPKELQNKLDYCTNELVVKERYVVMKKD